MRKFILATVAAAVVLGVPMASAVKAEDTTIIKKSNDEGDRSKTIIKKDEPSDQKTVIIKKDHDD